MKTKIFLLTSCAFIFLAAISVVAEEEKKGGVEGAVKQAAAKSPTPQGTPIALTVEAVQELEERKKSLDARESELAEKAKALEIQEKVLKDKLKRMEELNRKMAERLDTFKKEHEGKVMKLVAVVEKMKPQASAEYLENLEPELAVEILARVQVERAAKILNLVDKQKGARLTELYTGYRDSIPVPATQAPASPTSATEVQPNNAKM